MPEQVEETFHKAAIQLLAAVQRGRFKSVVFTSCRARSGSTTAVYNVTQSLHDLGVRPLMLEVNRRRPAFSRLWQADREKTIDRVANGSLTLKEAIHVSSSGLAMVASAPAIQNGNGNGHAFQRTRGADALAPSALAPLITQAEAEADIVLIDAPPILEHSDAMLVASVVPRVVLVVEAGVTTTETVDRVRRELEQRNIEIVGAILNKQRRYIPNWIYRMVTK